MYSSAEGHWLVKYYSLNEMLVEELKDLNCIRLISILYSVTPIT